MCFLLLNFPTKFILMEEDVFGSFGTQSTLFFSGVEMKKKFAMETSEN